jgi:hypothetical protein
VLIQHGHPHVNGWLTVRNPRREFFTWLPFGRIYSQAVQNSCPEAGDMGLKMLRLHNQDF